MFEIQKLFAPLVFAVTLAGENIMSIKWSVAHEGASGIVKERMMLMKDISKNMQKIAVIGALRL